VLRAAGKLGQHVGLHLHHNGNQSGHINILVVIFSKNSHLVQPFFSFLFLVHFVTRP
jgi:hypothetical protein